MIPTNLRRVLNNLHGRSTRCPCRVNDTTLCLYHVLLSLTNRHERVWGVYQTLEMMSLALTSVCGFVTDTFSVITSLIIRTVVVSSTEASVSSSVTWWSYVSVSVLFVPLVFFMTLSCFLNWSTSASRTFCGVNFLTFFLSDSSLSTLSFSVLSHYS